MFEHPSLAPPSPRHRPAPVASLSASVAIGCGEFRPPLLPVPTHRHFVLALFYLLKVIVTGAIPVYPQYACEYTTAILDL